MGSSHQDKLLRKVSKLLHELDCLLPGQRILVALSGGKDSTTMLSLLSNLKFEFKFDLIAAYIDHGTRKETKAEAKYLSDLCNEQGIPFVTKMVKNPSKLGGYSPEEVLRDERYGLLEELRVSSDSQWIATGHHADDNAETILFRLSQGAGISGLAGIPVLRGNIIRPMITLSSVEIGQYVEEFDLPFFEDSTNSDIAIPRNFIRHSILKKWKESYPEIIQGINTSSQNLIEAEEAIQFLADKFADKIDSIDADTWSFDRVWFDELPINIKLRLIFSIISSKASARRDIWTRIKDFLSTSQTGNLLNLYETWTLINDRNKWVLTQNFSPENASVKVNSEAVYECGNFVFAARREKLETGFNSTPNIELVDEDSIDLETLELRPWKHGDSFIPLGMRSEKKISDFLIDEKISRWQKERQYVLTSNSEIIWVCGLRISDKVKITRKTNKILKLSWIERNKSKDAKAQR